MTSTPSNDNREPDVESPLLSRPEAASQVSVVLSALPVFGLGATMIVSSACLIGFNKYLMAKDRFPFPVVLVLMHCTAASCMAAIIYLVKPSLLKSLNDVERTPIDREFIITRAFPIAVLFTISLIFGNTAYEYCSVAFLQMVKESNCVTVYVLGIMLGIDYWKTKEALVLLGVIMATSMTIRGELHFSLIGCVIQVSACLCESTKMVIQSILLSGSLKLDPLTYILTVMPLCSLLLGSLLVMDHFIMDLPGIEVPSQDVLWKYSRILPSNICLALILNLSSATFLGYSSALSFVMVNLMKDTAVVLFSALIMGEIVSQTQVTGFTLQLAFIAVWSYLKHQAQAVKSAGPKGK